MLNKVIVIGNVTKEVEIKSTTSGKHVVTKTVAVPRSFKNANGTYDTDFINLVAYGGTAYFLSNYAKKGTRIAISGSWNTRTYQDNNGKTQYVNECLVTDVDILTPKEKEQTKVETKNENDNPFNIDDPYDLPFWLWK